MKYTSLIILLVSCLLGCNSKQNNNSQKHGEIIKVTEKSKILSTLKIADFFSQIEIVLLEDSPNAIIGNPHKLRIYNNKIYIQDKQRNCITVFNAKGELIFSTKKQNGKGPGQYVSCGSYTIKPKSGNILILDHFKSKIIEYDLTGKFINQLNYPKDLILVDDFEVINEDIYAFYSTKGFQDKEYCLVLFNTKNNEIFRELASTQVQRLHISTNSNILYRIDGSIHLNHTYPSSSTYFIENDTYQLSEKYHYDFEKLNFVPSVLPRNNNPKLHNAIIQDYYSKYAIIFDKFENKNNVFVSFFHDNSSGIAIYSKSTKECHTKLNPPRSKGMLLPPQFVDDEYLYYLTMSENSKYLIHPELLSESVSRELKKSSKNNNIIIIKYKFKTNI